MSFYSMHNGWLLGMHVLWWLFWVPLTIVLVTLLLTTSRGVHRQQTPLEILQRRYAAGEISTEEYLERKKQLEPDKPAGSG
jgi:putative membrane protein